MEPSEIRENILPGKVFSFELRLSSERLSSLHLFFHSLNPRVKVVRQQTSGKEIHVGLEISTIGLSAGDVLSGKIDIVYNGGEITVPYEISIAMVFNGTVYDFKNVDAFAEFALREPDKAADMFGRRDFIRMPFLSDISARAVYQTFKSASADDSGLSAYLTALGKPVPEFRSVHELAAAKASPKRRVRPEGTSQDVLRLLDLVLTYDRISRGNAPSSESPDFDAEFTRLIENNRDNTLMRLGAAYYFLSSGNEKRAIEMLVVIQDQVKREKNEKRGNYVLFTYLTGLIRNDAEYMKTACEQAHRLYFENVGSAFYAYLEYRMNLADKAPIADCYQFLQSLSRRKVRSTAFLEETCFLFQKNTAYVGKLNDLEIRSMLFGLRHGLIDQQTLFDLLSCEITDRDLLSLYLLVLKCGYKRFQNPELLQAVVTIYVNESAFGPKYFPWYRRAAAAGMVVKGMNELYLQSVPKDYDAPIPRSIVLYFGYGRMPEHMPCDTLYMNVITFYSGDKEVWDLYSSRIRLYALTKMRGEDYSEQLVPIYRSVLEEKNLNPDTAAPMLQMLYLRRITTTVPSPRKLVVHYPQLRQEAVYIMKGSSVLIPVFSEKVVYAVEDIAGFRRSDPGLRSVQLFDDPELRTKCMFYVKNSLFTTLSRLDDVLDSGITDDYQETLARSVIREQNLDERYRAFLYAELASYALLTDRNSEDFSTFLLDADLSEMNSRERADVLQTLIGTGFVDSAFKRGKETGFEVLSDTELLKLLRPILNKQGDTEDDDLLYLCQLLYSRGKADNRVMEYLGSCLNSGTKDLLSVLKALREKHIPTGDMVIRTMTQMLYTGETRGIEDCFEWFMSEARWDDQLFRAYLVFRSHGYLLNRHPLTDTESEALRTHAKELSTVSVLALLTWYAKTKRDVTDEDREIVDMLLTRAAEEDIVLSCFSGLSKRFGLPEELEGRAFFEFRGENVESVTMVGTILPDKKFFQRTLTRVYGPIFAKSVVLYPGEWINYYYSVRYEDGTTEELEGPAVTLNASGFTRNSRLSDVSGLTAGAESTDLKSSAEFVKSLLLKDEMIRDIFRQ